MNCNNNEQLNFTCGGDQQLYVTLRREGQAFPAELSDDVVLNIVSDRAERINVSFQLGDEGRLIATLPGEQFRRPGSYGVEVVGLLNGTKWRAWRKRCIRYTPDTQPAATRSTAQQADPYDITIDVGLVQDIIPRRTSELVNDGEDGNDPFAKVGDVVEVLKHYAPLDSPIFTGIPRVPNRRPTETGYGPSSGTGIVASEFTVDNIINYRKGATNGIASLGNDGKVPVAQIPDLPYIKQELKGKPNGVAELDANRLVWDDQLRLGWRGYFTGDLDATNTKPGIYGIDDRQLSPDILGGEKAHGIFIQMPDVDPRNYRTQILIVGRNAQSANGDATETYTRRYLPGKSGWGAWGRSDRQRYSLAKSGSNIQLLFDGKVVATVADSNTTYKAMTQAQANAGTATTGLLISPSVLKNAIDKHTEGKATIDFVNSSVQTATAEFKGTHNSLEELQAVEGADRNDYGYVVETDAAGNKVVRRYKYVEGAGWQWEYDLNTTGFTAEEWQAVKSGINPELVQKLRSLPEPDATMPLTRMTDTLLNPDECLEPGVYENVEFPTVEYDYGIGVMPSPSQSDKANGTLSPSQSDKANGTLIVSKVHSTDSVRTVQQLMVRTSGLALYTPVVGGYTGSSKMYDTIQDTAEVIVRAIRFEHRTYNYPATPASITLNPDGTITEIPGTPARSETVEVQHVGAWVPMATFANIKSLAALIQNAFALKTDLPDISGKQDVQSTTVYNADSTAADFTPVVTEYVTEGDVTYTKYRFYFRTDTLPNNATKTFSFAALMADYTVKEWTNVSGSIDNGHRLSSGRTDNVSNVAILQQLGRNSKELIIRTYGDLSAHTAILQLEFYGEKAVPIG